MFTALTFLLIGSNSLPGPSPDPADLVPTPEVQMRCRALVRQLGSDDFERREDAQRRIEAHGRVALTALLAGVASADPEIRARCVQLLPRAAELDLQARLDTFRADTAGEYEHDLPGWTAFRRIACEEWRLFGVAVAADRGREKAARDIFAELMATRVNRDLLRAVDGSRLELGERVVARKVELYELRNPRDGFDRRRSATVDEVAALTFAEAIAGTQYVPRRAVSVSYLIGVSGFDNEARADDPRCKVYRALAVAWIDSRADPRELDDAMKLATKLGLTERAADLAARVLTAPGIITFLARSSAIRTLVNYGSKRHVAVLERGANRSVLTTLVKSPALPRYEVQLRDVTLALAIVLSEQKLTDYGFSDMEATVSGSPPQSYSYNRYYFEGEMARARAFDKWAEWRKANADK